MMAGALSRRELLAGAGTIAFIALVPAIAGAGHATPPETFPFRLSDAEWRKRLSPEAYAVLRHEATEAPGSSPLNDQHHAGIFACAGCAQPAYSSKTKFDSGTGWPSFWAPLPHAVATRKDTSLLMTRDEVHCTRCGGHLGHVFDDGPKPTGLRYCMNGAALHFLPA